MKALIDGDIIAYRFAFINEYDIDFGDEGEPSIITIAKAEEAMVDVDHFIQWILDTTGCDEYIVCLTGKDNFRYNVLPEYKNNRNESTVPTLVDVLKKYMIKSWNAQREPKLEADDLMSIYADKDSVICTIDKDLDHVVGHHFNWNKKEKYEIDEIQAKHFFYIQSLMGDSTDGIRGCPKVGKVNATKVADDIIKHQYTDEEAFEVIFEIYKQKYLKYIDEDASDKTIMDYMTSMVNAVRLLGKEDYDFKTKEVVLWQPSLCY